MFFKYLAKQKGYYIPNTKSYQKYHTTMDYLQTCINSYQVRSNPSETIPFSDILNFDLYDSKKVNYQRQAKSILKNIKKCNAEIQYVYANLNIDKDMKHMLARDIIKKRQGIIENMTLNPSTMIYLLTLIERDDFKDIKNLVFYTLFSCANNSFYKTLKESIEPITILAECPKEISQVQIYDFYFTFLQF